MPLQSRSAPSCCFHSSSESRHSQPRSLPASPPLAPARSHSLPTLIHPFYLFIYFCCCWSPSRTGYPTCRSMFPLVQTWRRRQRESGCRVCTEMAQCWSGSSLTVSLLFCHCPCHLILVHGIIATPPPGPQQKKKLQEVFLESLAGCLFLKTATVGLRAKSSELHRHLLKKTDWRADGILFFMLNISILVLLCWMSWMVLSQSWTFHDTTEVYCCHTVKKGPNIVLFYERLTCYQDIKDNAFYSSWMKGSFQEVAWKYLVKT